MPRNGIQQIQPEQDLGHRTLNRCDKVSLHRVIVIWFVVHCDSNRAISLLYLVSGLGNCTYVKTLNNIDKKYID
ncbi:hypothetical protein BpHYR1_003258 [Brachionus plicatilis]|uniref:Uncharacterized protein n=1 Tax=Brachionus plicatilis TaxID=10195 RepID=A0A3M7P2F0_BRAPC|nr:hypothetical protein BpHYR1_003258 [Brachionus plicatilis]